MGDEIKKFWSWNAPTNKVGEVPDGAPKPSQRALYLSGAISEESWFDDEVSPKLFRDELNAGSGDIDVWINSPGGDCVAAAQIYNMLMEYDGHVTVKIDGIAASAASVIAMAGDEVLVSPVSMIMIHNPVTVATGDSAEMQKASAMLDEVKESIMNAYENKTGLSRLKLARLMDAETWMDAHSAVDMGFADEIMTRWYEMEGAPEATASNVYKTTSVTNSLMEKIAKRCKIEKTEKAEDAETVKEKVKYGRSIAELQGRLDLLKKYL